MTGDAITFKLCITDCAELRVLTNAFLLVIEDLKASVTCRAVVVGSIPLARSVLATWFILTRIYKPFAMIP